MPDGVIYCELCGHTGMQMVDHCGYRLATNENGRRLYLCYGDDHDCWVAWQSGVRPGVPSDEG